MKLNHQTQYFINGLILLFLGVLSITILPVIITKLKITIPYGNLFYRNLELFLLCACSVFYLFSPKFYKQQVISILFAMMFFNLFVKFYN